MKKTLATTTGYAGRGRHEAVQLLVTILIVSALSACATPGQRIDREAQRLGFNVGVVASNEFTHRVYSNRLASSDAAKVLHVYLEGDGSPWVNHRFIARDPTPRVPLALRLMALDPQPSLYLGRPCYHGYAGTPPCEPELWTNARYSKRVVDSMAEALNRQIQGRAIDHLAFFGYSGGGVLAMLLAERMPQTRVVVTVAANLDTDAWVRLHGYTPLRGSINPADRPPLNASIRQLHLAGGRDSNVPPWLLRPVSSKQYAAELFVVSEFDHICCWQDLWPEVIAWVSQRDTRFRSQLVR